MQKLQRHGDFQYRACWMALIESIEMFPDEAVAEAWFTNGRWSDGLVPPAAA